MQEIIFIIFFSQPSLMFVRQQMWLLWFWMCVTSANNFDCRWVWCR